MLRRRLRNLLINNPSFKENEFTKRLKKLPNGDVKGLVNYPNTYRLRVR